MSRHEHTKRLQGFIRELREWVGSTPTGGLGAYPGHRPLNLIIADALDAVDDEMAAIDAAARDITPMTAPTPEWRERPEEGMRSASEVEQ